MVYLEFEKNDASKWIGKTFAEWQIDYANSYKKNEFWKDSLTPLECYCAGYMTRVNELLRTGSSSVNIEKLHNLKRFLDDDFKSAPMIQDNIVVYRYVDVDEFNQISQSDTGFIDKGYLSTTLNKRIYLEQDSRLNYLDTDYVLKIYVKKGTKALFVSGFDYAIENEFELLFKRNSKLVKHTEPYWDNDFKRNILECLLKD
ncbi:ADP-ribosyltransferase [Streptococcus mitis]|jgi:hypothetical protein|uniref:ADP-ribosyltransferase n=1 Tax=Streptococcus mitis TaxID=28037 RepID=UPI002240A7D6